MAYQSRIWSYSQGDPCRWTCCKGHRIVRIAFLRSFVLWRIIFWFFCSGVHRNRISISDSHRLRHHCIWRNQYRYRISWSAFYRLFLVWSSSKQQIFRQGDHAKALIALGNTKATESIYQKIGELTKNEILTVERLLDENVPSFLSWAKEIAKLFF